MSARRLVLDALPRHAPAGELRTVPAATAPGDGSSSPGADHLLARFVTAAAAVGATTSGPIAEAAVAADIVARLQAWGARRVVGWTDPRGRASGVLGAAAAAGLEIVAATIPPQPPARTDALGRVGLADVGITDALGGFADTGSVVLTSGPGRARLAWLLPARHVVVLSRDRIHATLADFLAAHGNDVTRAAHLAIVTGPSRTADIELTLTRGVHGPKDVHIVIVS